MIDSLPVFIWFFTDIDTYGRVNNHYADLLGVPREAIECKCIDDFCPAKDVDACRQSNRDVCESKKTASYDMWILDSRGRGHLMKIIKTPRFDERGNLLHIMCVGLDITDSRDPEIPLIPGEENFQTFIETIDDIVVVGNSEGEIIYANPAASVRLGYTPDELCTMHILDMHPEYVREEAVTLLSEMLRDKRTVCPLPLISKSGRLIPVETRAWPGTWNGIPCIFGISKDLSKEQEALQEFDRFFRMNPAPMVVSRASDRILVNVNEAFLKDLGFSRDEVLGKTSSELGLFIAEEDMHRSAKMLFEYGQIRDVDSKVKAKDGTIHDGLFSGEIIESQGVTYFLTVMIDITERKQAEAERQQTIEALSLALKEIQTLRGIVPICAHCKKIRNDTGYWDQVETYVSRHTQAQFSHGICPECMSALYPDFSHEEPGPLKTEHESGR